MAEAETEAQYNYAFRRRIAAARTALGWSQREMAEALHMPQDKYKQYETRSLLPHHLIPRFCLIAHVDMQWLLTGRGQMTAKKQQQMGAIVHDIEVVTKTGKKRVRKPRAA